MSIELTKYPVTESDGLVHNIFAGFDEVEIEFSRKDADILSVGSGLNAKVLITVAGDVSASLKVGEWVYLYAIGGSYTYDNSYKITNVFYNTTDTEITVDTDYIESSTNGYINYKQNWFLEAVLVNPDNELIRVYNSELSAESNPKGEVSISAAMLVDALKNDILTTSQEIASSRAICRVKYREVWRENQTNAYTFLSELQPIIVIYAAENAKIESVINGFELPKMYDGYPFALNILHSIQNLTENRLAVTFDELNINKDIIKIGVPLASFKPSDFGILQVNFADNEQEIDDTTRYIKFNIESSDKADFQTSDFNDIDFLTENTP